MNHHFNPLGYCPVGTLKKSREHDSQNVTVTTKIKMSV